MLTLYGSVRSRTFRVLWMLEELGVAYEHIPVPPRAEELAAVDTGGKIPVLVTDDGALWDSVAIMTWLGDHFGGFTHPAGSFARARQDAMTLQIVDEFDALLWMASRHSFILPEERRVPAVKDSLKWEFVRSQTRIATRADGAEYLAGDTPTIPDILLTHCCNWSISAKFPLTNPWVQDHAKRMRARPAFQRVRALDQG